MVRVWPLLGSMLSPSLILLRPGAFSAMLPSGVSGSWAGVIVVWNTSSSCWTVPLLKIVYWYFPAATSVGVVTLNSARLTVGAEAGADTITTAYIPNLKWPGRLQTKRYFPGVDRSIGRVWTCRGRDCRRRSPCECRDA